MREIRETLKEPERGEREDNRSKGAAREQEACAYLRAAGYRILEQNYRIRSGEIDLIAADGDEIVFCEVKYRRTSGGGPALEAVDGHKQYKILQTARYYLMRHPAWSEKTVRFDVIGIDGGGRITHIKNAFQEW